MKKILGLDLGTNSIGWGLVEQDLDNHKGGILGAGSRIIPMSQDILGKFDAGVTESQTAKRTAYRGTRRLYERNKLRRERLHRVLNVIGFLPSHYVEAIDFERRLGQFKEGGEVKLNYKKIDAKDAKVRYEFLFLNSFNEMVSEFNNMGYNDNIPYDWTIYYLRNKALNQKVTKEELAWIILNFNQKRGYYQLRGEEEADKNKHFVQLAVKELIDTGEEVKGKKLYEIVFDNGWKYDKQIVKTEDWIGRTKEFIVTIKDLKSGEKKYSYKSVDSEVDWLAIKSKTERDIDKSGVTVGQYIFSQLLANPNQKIRGKLIKTIERKYYRNELKQILKAQEEYHTELRDEKLYGSCLMELYSRNEAHRNNIKSQSIAYLIEEDIIFYQRPLKSKKSSIGGCQFEYRTYHKKDQTNGEVSEQRIPLKAIPKSHPLYQEFRLWQFVQNITIIDKDLELTVRKAEQANITKGLLTTQEDIVDLYDELNSRKEIEQKNVIDYFVKKGKIEKANKGKYKWNYVEDKKYPCNETRYEFLKRLKKVNGVKPHDFLTNEIELKLWHLIYSVTDKVEYEKSIENFAKRNGIDVASFVEAFENMPPYKSDYGTLSHKAIKKILPLMRKGKYWKEDAITSKTSNRIQKLIDGEYDESIRDRVRQKAINLKNVPDFSGLPFWLASYIVYDRHSEGADVSKWRTTEDIDQYLNNFKQHRLRNPIVEQVVTETLRVVRDIWDKYGEGKQDFFDEIHLELGREMKNSADKRKQITSRQSENENTNERIRFILEELQKDSRTNGDIRAYSPSHQELLKIYEDGVYQNPEANFSIVSEDEIYKIRRNSSPSHSDIQRYKLWLEQGYISPYTGAVISLSKLYTAAYQIEHIIPQSRYFDNSLNNKIICESDVNQDKGNMTAYEYLSRRGGEIVDGHELLSLENYETHCQRYFKKNRTKLANLLSEDIPEGFINRQMNDSRYISKFVKSLLSNIVREEGEQEPTAKNLLPVTGAITNKLKQDWGLHDKWNEIIAPRFMRLNELTKSNDYGYYDKKINTFRITVPPEIRKGFSKKRIDHRHHALDAIVIACTTREHINYLNALNAEKENFKLRSKLLIKNKEGHFTKHFKMPWDNYPIEVKQTLEQIIVSFKQNNRVINKTNNKTWQWVEEQGRLTKKLVKQKGTNWAIRKPLHKETIAGKINHISTPKGKIATASRVSLTEIKNRKHLNKITDISIQKILLSHLNSYMDKNGKPQYDIAFSTEGIEDMNKNIKELNGGVAHKPILKVRQYEIGTKFQVGTKGNNHKKYVEAAKGTNLFFAVYWDEKKQKRTYETVPLNEVVEHQKQTAHLPKTERLAIQPNPEKGTFLFTLSPNDLVYIPSDEDISQPDNVNFKILKIEDSNRIYKLVSTTGTQAFFIKSQVAKSIANRIEFSTLNKMEKDTNGGMIKARCWKIEVNRTGEIVKINKGVN